MAPDSSLSASDTSSISTSPLLGVSSDGLVNRAARQRLISTCKLSLILFPFDTQRCRFTFSSYTSYGDDNGIRLLRQMSQLGVSHAGSNNETIKRFLSICPSC